MFTAVPVDQLDLSAPDAGFCGATCLLCPWRTPDSKRVVHGYTTHPWRANTTWQLNCPAGGNEFLTAGAKGKNRNWASGAYSCTTWTLYCAHCAHPRAAPLRVHFTLAILPPRLRVAVDLDHGFPTANSQETFHRS